MPFLPINLAREGASIDTFGLVDTGASVNVLPYAIGQQLGLVWDDQRVGVTLSGNLGREPAKAVLLDATVAPFEAVRLAFAWSASNDAPLILGQTNFLMEFDACFHRSRLEFEIRASTSSGD